ncbi:hypothetical protein T4B_8879 [Trichinella pseudospiralis]|uniref:Uncharacterized protein n=1 Tax=Trichinella pseudospiralis TaxID=6337 RepID=A0A0V1GMP3_TRIPS|nr:hypothetical protein T4B_2596 [Trichinella pseudospiralis]KRY99353.1 hypothetical protein T4B_8879 [Trichinella pseudospiralis]
MKRCCFCSNPEAIVTPKEKRIGIIHLKLFCFDIP